MVANELDYVLGVDTHRDEHTLALVEAATGAVLGQRTVASNGRGYAQALRFAQELAEGVRLWAVEGAGHYGAGLARHLSERGETVLDVTKFGLAEHADHRHFDSVLSMINHVDGCIAFAASVEPKFAENLRDAWLAALSASGYPAR
jgi:hypothetical protein